MQLLRETVLNFWQCTVWWLNIYEFCIEVYMKQDEGELLDNDLDLFSGPQSQPAELDQTIDYNFAQQELMMNEYSNDPIQEAICDLEKQYEEDKQGKEPGGCTSTSTQGESALIVTELVP